LFAKFLIVIKQSQAIPPKNAAPANPIIKPGVTIKGNRIERPIRPETIPAVASKGITTYLVTAPRFVRTFPLRIKIF